MSSIAQDLRSAARVWRRSPWSTAGLVLILALGTGLNSAVLALTYGILLRPLPYAEPSRLVILQHRVTLPDLDRWRRGVRTLDGLSGFAVADHALRGLGEPRIVTTAFVTRDFFAVLRAPVAAGRSFEAGDVKGVVLSQRVVDAAGLDRAAVPGMTVRIADGAFTVIGVMPRSVAMPSEAADVWLPAEAAPAIPLLRSDERRYTMLARLKPGVTLDQVRDDAARVAREIGPPDGRDRTVPAVTVVALDQQVTAAARPVLRMLTAAAALVLLVTCANVTSLLLGRAAVRERETAIRLALGAGAARLLRRLLVEGLILSAAGSVLGVIAAVAAVSVLRGWAATLLPRLEEVRLDLPVLGLTFVVALLVAAACTIAPALHAVRRGLGPLVRQGERITRSGGRVTGALVTAQIAISVVVLVAGALLGQTVGRLLAIDAGIEARHAFTMKLMLGERTMLRPGERRAFVEDLLRETAALPGVVSAGLGSSLPPHTSLIDMAIRVVDGGRDESQMMSLVAVRGDYLAALGARVISGRTFRPDEFGGQVAAVVVSRSVAHHLFRGRDAVGQEMPVAIPGGGGKRARVVGVIEDVRYTGLAGPGGGSVYVPWDQLPIGSLFLVVRTAGDPAAAVAAARAVVHRLDPEQPIAQVRSLEETVRSSIADRRLHAFLVSSFASLGFTVALIGLVAALGRAVIGRRRELAVRCALGATPRDTVGLVMTAAAWLVFPGVSIGAVLALAAARALAAQLFGVSAYDPPTYAAVAAGTSVAALLACAAPAYRAASVDPGLLLRSE